MSYPADPSLLLPRTCTTNDDQSSGHKTCLLADFRNAPAYVLLGDPGAGKTSSFEQEALATGGHYVRARSFANLKPSRVPPNSILFIDGLDEMRAGGGDGRTPLDHIRRHLDRLGRPRFRLSCREADWYGESDRSALQEAAPGGSLTVLHLNPLSDADILLLLERRYGVADPAIFIQQADNHGLADLLVNPQTLGLLTSAVGNSSWPGSRTETYELACRQLLRESNAEHRAAKRDTAPTHNELIDATGFLGAILLLAGIAGFALDEDAANSQHVLWRELSPTRELPLSAALASGLFQRDECEQQRIPIHRSIAEFLGARYLAEQVAAAGLPLGRVIALMVGKDGGIVPDLRGLAAWLAVQSRSARSQLVDRDPLGVVLYGDVRGFPTDDKRRVLAALEGEAMRYPHFRSENWTAAPFGALATPDMLPVFHELLAKPSRNETDVALLDCALDALRYGPSLTEIAPGEELQRLEELLNNVVRDASYPSYIRHSALEVLLRELPRNATSLVSLARNIEAALVEDQDDQLLGKLLTELFPEFIRSVEVFDFLHPVKRDNFIGQFHMFWSHRLPDDAPDELLPELMNELVKRSPMLRKSLKHLQAERMAGRLLARVLDTYGDNTDDAQLYPWLGTGLNEYGTPRIDDEHQRQVSAWLTARPERYKTVFLEGVRRCIGEKELPFCLYQAASRLYDAHPPSDIIPWYLERAAAETHDELKQYFFSRAATQLARQSGQEWLTLDALDYLAPWMREHPEFERDLEPFVSLPIDHWRKQEAARKRKWDRKQVKRMESWRSHFREHFDTIRDGSASPSVLYELAQVYLNMYSDIQGETPNDRLNYFLGGDEELISAAYTGFRRCLDRDDLPSVAEIVDLETEGRMHLIRQPCLAGMEELYGSDRDAALQLDDEVLRRLLAFGLTGLTSDTEWFKALVKRCPSMVAEVLVAYALPLLRNRHEHVRGIWELAYDTDFGQVARLAVPDLLKSFPLRAKNSHLRNALDPLLKAALRHIDSSVLDTIISEKLGKRGMSAPQRVYWLACGLLASPGSYETTLVECVGASKTLRAHLGAFFHEQRRCFSNTALPESSLGLLIELLAPDSPPEHLMRGGWVSPPMQTAEEVRNMIDTLGGNPSEAAQQQLERLQALPLLTPWRNRLRQAAHTQRIAWRKASFRQLSAIEVCKTLANREPANAADLAALTYECLCALADKIRDGSTNDYKQYWSLDESNKRPVRPKPENDCRDALLSDLKERLGLLGVDAVKEGYYAEEKRADIRVSYDGAMGLNVPIEIKKDNHSDLWRSVHEQLIERYTRDPGTDGYGIYLVFWFGGEGIPMPQEGKKPRNAAELQQCLRSTLTKEEERHISVCVIDCALP